MIGNKMNAKNKFKRQLLKHLRTCNGIHDATTLWQQTQAWASAKRYFMGGEYGYLNDHISMQISNGTEREEFKVYLKDLVKPVKVVSRLKKVKKGWKRLGKVKKSWKKGKKKATAPYRPMKKKRGNKPNKKRVVSVPQTEFKPFSACQKKLLYLRKKRT